MASTNSTNGTNGINGHEADAICTPTQFLNHEFDFIICGGGTAGLVLAARLTEDPNVKVGVIEAGKWRKDDMLVDTPAMFTQMLGNPEYDWNFMTTPQKGNQGKVHHMPRGKALGGSSATNYQMYVRGSDSDYDDWAAIINNDEWSSKNTKQYMRKHQTLEPISEAVVDRSAMPFIGEHHGTEGPVRTSFNEWRLPIEDDIIAALDDVSGFAKKPMDPWSGDHIGFYNTLGAVVRTGPNAGKRSYAARGYFEANKDRSNLKVLTQAMVTKVILEGNKAVGVEFSAGGSTHSTKVKREVLVCGGTVQSPQILELSGIGDPQILQAAGVECKVNLPTVGTNLTDHTVSAVGYELADGQSSLDAIHDPQALQAAFEAYATAQSGPLSCISGVQGFLPYKNLVTTEELEKTIQSIEATKAESGTSEQYRKQLDQIIAQLRSDKSANLQAVFIATTSNFGNDGVQDQSKLFVKPSGTRHGSTIAICGQYPVARGTVHITSSDVNQHPAIDPRYLAHPADVDVLAAGLRFADRAFRSKKISAKIADRYFPSPELDLEDLEVAKKVVQEICMGEYHVSGTCAMGSVVDASLKVKGVEGLRVVDASIFPNNVSGNIVSSVYMVAEKGADLIKADWAA